MKGEAQRRLVGVEGLDRTDGKEDRTKEDKGKWRKVEWCEMIVIKDGINEYTRWC